MPFNDRLVTAGLNHSANDITLQATDYFIPGGLGGCPGLPGGLGGSGCRGFEGAFGFGGGFGFGGVLGAGGFGGGFGFWIEGAAMLLPDTLELPGLKFITTNAAKNTMILFMVK